MLLTKAVDSMLENQIANRGTGCLSRLIDFALTLCLNRVV